ncbi:uncharacterized protein [Physcomitrium patens]|uniref:Myb-like domain-containing protein n=1 Tax=Physcomitrium patens TaxID=3218 RepID=A0A2K1IJV9_PHYPA|nr:uncharacterized protein LOC112276173 isoform X2 [Physcomitrium patens]PNR29563.1 hypothetical protein PHYPA_028257 [Physcomitrium patens]|eukprot:XP_024363029.1 uncharacterized protein LOC112276173 isoform X2 [Physcomitrella patens]
MTFLAEGDTEVDPQLGYPHAYPKLCRHAYSTGLPMPFTQGPPQRFVPFSPQPEDFQLLKDWDSVFPVVAESERDSSNAQKFAEELWRQLDHLGNAGFDPEKFRVDPYGNVVHWNADPSSPLAWDIDHWFPQSRGGKTELPNLRIVQWQAYARKRNRLEFLVPWWDLQHGCSINQFLSAFAAKNADFRKRSFALFFSGGEDELVAREHVGECRPWPQQFREKKALCGLAAAGIVTVSKTDSGGEGRASVGSATAPTSVEVSQILGSYPYGAILGSPNWTAEEEEAVKRGVNKFGHGSWKEIKENDSALTNRSAMQLKEKYRFMRAVSRNLVRENSESGQTDISGRQSAATTALQKELRVKIMKEEEKREREDELAQLEGTVVKLKLESEKERIKAQELEALLKKHKHRLEKQRKLAESQTSYRLCLERVLRDTMHQTLSYKEQARLTREACNVLIARIDSEKASCEAMEGKLLQQHSRREQLEATAVQGNVNGCTTTDQKKQVTRGRDIVDVTSCIFLRAADEEDDEEEEKLIMNANQLSESDTNDEGDEIYNFRRDHQQAAARKSLVTHAIKVLMQVEDTKEAVEVLPRNSPPKLEAEPSCPKYFRESRKGAVEMREMLKPHQWYKADNETLESESDCDFADDEMSPAIRLSTDAAWKDDENLLRELSQFHGGPISELRDYCAQNSNLRVNDLNMADRDAFERGRPPLSEPAIDIPVPSTRESRSDSKREVPKDVIMVQTERSKANADTAASCEQKYVDKLYKPTRFRTPTSELTGEAIAGDPPSESKGHLDELLEQILDTHMDNVRQNDAKQHQSNDIDEEKLKEIGKSNLDKWLQVLLFKDAESPCSSPGRGTPLQATSPALSSMSVAVMRESLERARQQELMSRDDENVEGPKSLWGALLRKMSAKQQLEYESAVFEPKEDYDIVDEARSSDAVKPLPKISPTTDLATKQKPVSGALTEGRGSGCDSDCALPGRSGGNQLDSIVSNLRPKDANIGSANEPNPLANDSSVSRKTDRRVEDGVLETQPSSFEKRHSPRPLSDVEETSETESTDNLNQRSKVPTPEIKHPHGSKIRSIKVAAFVGWKKSSKSKPMIKSSHVDEVAQLA